MIKRASNNQSRNNICKVNAFSPTWEDFNEVLSENIITNNIRMVEKQMTKNMKKMAISTDKWNEF